MYKPKITKEEVNQMQVAAFDGKITIVDSLSKVQPAIDELRKCKIVGIDTETKPSFTRGTHYKVSLLQISTTDHCYLFRLNKIPFPEELAAFLANDKIRKIGLALHDDFTGLNRHLAFKPANFIDLQSIVKSYGILELGLQKIFAIVFQQKISKSQRLTNWENDVLTEQQQIYAATDAWASLLIYLKLKSEKTLSKKQIEQLMTEIAAKEAALMAEKIAEPEN